MNDLIATFLARLCLTIVFSLLLPIAVLTQTATLPPAAQKALDAGIASAKAGDLQTAIKLLDDARKSAPYSPAIYFNLGLAESKIPGRELRAICSFEALPLVVVAQADLLLPLVAADVMVGSYA